MVRHLDLFRAFHGPIELPREPRPGHAFPEQPQDACTDPGCEPDQRRSTQDSP
jgi:hypothetical protein